MDGDMRVDLPDAGSHGLKMRLIDQIRLIEDDHIREGDLTDRFGAFIECGQDVDGVNDRDDRVEPGFLPQIFIEEKSLRDGGRVRKPGGFDDDSIKLLTPPQKALPKIRIRSPRTVQQIQPLFVSKTSSSAFHDEVIINAKLANSLISTANLRPCCAERIWLSNGFACTEEAVKTVTVLFSDDISTP